jgi:YebC/PmpR family DNA-binding regulatory protein
MAGHSKWSKVKRIKGALDVKRGAIFSKLSKEITVAARMGGGDPALNHRLRSAVQAARAQNMPSDNIDRAIKKGTGELESPALEELIYEGYAPGGVAILLEVMTDNKNRTAADLRLIFSKHHGNLATSGSVAYLFHKKGQITVPLSAASEDRMLELVLETGGEEFVAEGDHYVIATAPDQLYAVAESLKSAGVVAENLKLTYLPQNTVPVTDETVAAQVIRLCDALDECDDVQSVHANFEIPEEILGMLSL